MISKSAFAAGLISFLNIRNLNFFINTLQINPKLKKMIENIQIRRYNAIRNSGYLKKKRFD